MSMKKFLIAATVAAVLAFNAGAAAAAATIPWKSPRYSLVARAMQIREALETFGTAQGISVVMSKAVGGVFSGSFRDVPAGEFLDRIATSHNLIWYYDGAALYVYASGEVQTFLLDLKYMKAGEVRALIRELGVEDARYPIKTASNDELIMVSGPPRYVTLVAETIAKADKLRELRTFNEVEVRVFPLVNTWADDVSFSVSGPESSVTIRGVARVLEEIMTTSSGGKVRESATNETQEVSRNDSEAGAFQPVIRPDNRLNAVIVRDVVTRFPMYEKLIRELDVPKKLVEIGVTVVELSREDALDWQLSFKVDAAKDDVEGAVGQNARNLFDGASLSGKGLAGAVTYLGEDVDVSASLSALREKGKARSISRTSLLTLDNLAAQLTDTQSYHARVVGTEVATLEEVTAGTKLQIKPRIVRSAGTNTPDRVWLTMELQDGGFESVTVDAMPMTRTSTLETQASVRENHSILLAGYMRDIKESGGWGIPYLRDIPWIGWLFGGASYRDATVQRLFILTPYIVDADAPDVVREQATRQRDVMLEETIERDKDVDDIERRERNEQLEEQQEIREEAARERHHRNSEERAFRREQRQDRQKADRSAWERDFETRKARYEEEKGKASAK
jgi:type III secretion protein C